MPLQKGDIRATEASNFLIEDRFGKQSYKSIEEGVDNFQWYLSYYQNNI